MGLPSEKARQRLVWGFFKNHADSYTRLLAMLESGETPRIEVFERMGEVIEKKGAYLRKVFTTMRNMRHNGIAINPPENRNPKVKITTSKQERKYRAYLKSFQRNHPSIWHKLKAILGKGESITDARKEEILRTDEKISQATLATTINLMRRFYGGDGDWEDDDVEEEMDGDERGDGDAYDMDGHELEDPSQPSTSGCIGNSERRNRRGVVANSGVSRRPAEKLSVSDHPSECRRNSSRTISTKRQHPSESPDALKAKRCLTDQENVDFSVQAKPRELREPATSPSPPPEHRNPRDDGGSMLGSRHEPGVAKPDLEVLTVENAEMQETTEHVLQGGTVEQLHPQDVTPEDKPDAEPETPKIPDNTISSFISDVAYAVAPELIVQGAEVFEGKIDLGTGESMPQLTDKSAAVVLEHYQETQDPQHEVLEHRPKAQPLPPSERRKGSAQIGVDANPDDSLESPRHPSSTFSVERHHPTGSLDAPAAKQIQREREDMDSTGQTGSRVLAETAECLTSSKEEDHAEEEDDVCLGSIYIDIDNTLEIIYNSLCQLKDEDVTEIGRSLAVDLKEMKSSLQQSTVPQTSSRNKQYLKPFYTIDDIKSYFKTLASYLNELPVEDRDGMSNELKLDLCKIQMNLNSWSEKGDAELVVPGVEAIKEEQMDLEEAVQVKTEYPEDSMEQQQQQQQIPAISPEQQIKQEPEEDPLADSDC